MTRVNAGIRPSELCNKHLLAEHREIKRIPNIIKSGKADLSNIPQEFTLGRGHVKFFYDKLLYLKKRYMEIYRESKRRGFEVTWYGDSFDSLPADLCNDWDDSSARSVLAERINEKLMKMKISEDIRTAHYLKA